jgi:hypothetical protein
MGEYLMSKKFNYIRKEKDYAVLYVDKLRVLIDMEDIEKVKDKWWIVRYNKTKPYIDHKYRLKQKDYRIILHRFLINCPDGLVVDHINGDTLDNRKVNLRACTQEQNVKNRNGLSVNNKSGYAGIFVEKNGFKVSIGRKYLGWVKDIDEAIKIRKEAEKERGYLTRGVL